MLEIILIRHGQTDWNRQRRIMGHHPIPLNAAGRLQALKVAANLRKVPLDRIVTSPFLRALETARILAKGRKIGLKLAPEVAEIGYGLWVGKKFDEVRGDKNFKIYHTRPRLACAPEGEKMTTVQKRAVGLIEKLRKQHKKGGRIAVVSHADVIKVILVHYMGLDLNDMLRFRIDNCGLSLLWFSEKRHRVMAVNCPPDPRQLFSLTDQLLPPRKKSSKKKK